MGSQWHPEKYPFINSGPSSNPIQPNSNKKFPMASFVSEALGIIISIQVFVSFIDHMEKKGSDNTQTLRTAFVFCILEGMPMGIIEVDDINGGDTHI